MAAELAAVKAALAASEAELELQRRLAEENMPNMQLPAESVGQLEHGELGRGASATVHKGTFHHQAGGGEPQRLPVAIKLFHRSEAGPVPLALLRELEIGLQIKQKNLTQYFGLWTNPGPPQRLCIVMELVEGGTLNEALQRPEAGGTGPSLQVGPAAVRGKLS